MSSPHRMRRKIALWAAVFGGPIIALIAFLLGFWIDPIHFGTTQPLSALPAFLLSVVILLISQAIVITIEQQNTSVHSDRIYNAIKDYLHVTPVGSLEEATRYIISRIPVLREVQNTSFNIDDETDRADEKFYQTRTYQLLIREIAIHCGDNLIWKDIGDGLAVDRLRANRTHCNQISRGRRNGYRFKLLSHQEPQINFILMESEDGAKEVLFNWDFRGNGQDPTVLISRDRNIVEMFAIQYTLLWRRGVEEHDGVV